MTKRRSANDDSRLGIQCLASLKVEERNVGGKNFGRHGKERRAHKVANRPFGGTVRRLMAGPYPECIAVLVGEREERQTEDMVDMTMGKKQIDLSTPFLNQGSSQTANT